MSKVIFQIDEDDIRSEINEYADLITDEEALSIFNDARDTDEFRYEMDKAFAAWVKREVTLARQWAFEKICIQSRQQPLPIGGGHENHVEQAEKLGLLPTSQEE